jgi:hypothetical protein
MKKPGYTVAQHVALGALLAQMRESERQAGSRREFRRRTDRLIGCSTGSSRRRQCARHSEMKERMVAKSAALSWQRKPPEIFCLTFIMRPSIIRTSRSP